MLDKIIPNKINYLFNLIRLNKPIGFMLLMWPCWFALAIIPQQNSDKFLWYIIFFVGAFLMRSSGCIINDLVDINIDSKVERTSTRPLTSNKISISESILVLFFLLSLSLIILFLFESKTILIGFISLPLIILYPFLKRYTYWPQLGLGIIFSWGVLMVSIQFTGKFTYEFIILYVACIFWTLAYDTVYAYQDIIDDINNKLKSTAVLFGTKGKRYVLIFYNLFFFTIGYLGFYASQNYISLIVMVSFIIVINIYLKKWDLNSKESCNFYFRFNNVIGLCCFIFLALF